MKSLPPLLAVLILLGQPVPGTAQGSGAGDGVRVGISFGGVSTVGLTLEFYRDTRSLDLTLGTWSFRDVSVSAVVKQYFGGRAARPFVGAGLWVVAAAPGDDRTGWALVLRAPVGVDWAVADSHALGAVINVNRGLWVRRANPDDNVPMNKRLVPLPELYYRLGR